MDIFTETKLHAFEKNKDVKPQGYFVPPDECTVVNIFRWNIRDGINRSKRFIRCYT